MPTYEASHEMDRKGPDGQPLRFHQPQPLPPALHPYSVGQALPPPPPPPPSSYAAVGAFNGPPAAHHVSGYSNFPPPPVQRAGYGAPPPYNRPSQPPQLGPQSFAAPGMGASLNRPGPGGYGQASALQGGRGGQQPQMSGGGGTGPKVNLFSRLKKTSN